MQPRTRAAAALEPLVGQGDDITHRPEIGHSRIAPDATVSAAGIPPETTLP
jgi:hypothetical protein